MWSEGDRPYSGRHYRLDRTLSSPQNVTRPRPPILIGGGGERKTLRLVARYADACNIFGGPQAAHKLEVLREHCEREGRDYGEIEKTTTLSLGEPTAEAGERLLEELRAMYELGFTVAYVSNRSPDPIRAVELLATAVIPEISGW
jgi:alkanesulfonate monooxygenase